MSEYTYLNRVKVDVTRLKLGMYVGELDKPWEQSSFMFQGFKIEDKATLNQLKRECEFVYIDFRDKQAYDIFLLEAQIENKADNEQADTDFAEELPRAMQVFKDASKANKMLIRKVQQGEKVNFSAVEKSVDAFIESLDRNERALVILCGIRHKIFYSEEHPVRVSILALAFGKYLGMNDDQLKVMGASSMLHDIGKVAIPEKVLNKSGKLTKEEAALLKQHPITSYKLLNQVEGISEVIKEVALSHHEREDGRGYPRHIPKDRVSRYAKIVSIIDAYDAITSERPYKAGQSPSQAFKILNNYKNKKFDGELVSEFVKWMGVMPVGSLVEMATGEIGLVLKNRQDKKLKPTVMLVTDEQKKSGFQKVVDLSKLTTHANGKPYQIKSVLPIHSFGINIEHYLNQRVDDIPGWLNVSKQPSIASLTKRY